MNNNLKKGGACPCSRMQQGGDCGCSSGLGFPLTGGGPFGKSRGEKMQARQEKMHVKLEKKQERREERREEGEAKPKQAKQSGVRSSNYLLSIAQANPDAFKTLCSIIPNTYGGQNMEEREVPKMNGLKGMKQKAMPFPLNLLNNPLQVKQVCSQIAANPDILSAPIASEVPTSNGSTVQEQLNILHNAANSSGMSSPSSGMSRPSYSMSGPSYGMGAATSAGPSGGGLFDMFSSKPNNSNILANDGRTVQQHLDELHENLHVPNNVKPNRNNSNVNNNSQIGLFGGRRKTRKTRKSRKSRKSNKARKTRTK